MFEKKSYNFNFKNNFSVNLVIFQYFFRKTFVYLKYSSIKILLCQCIVKLVPVFAFLHMPLFLAGLHKKFRLFRYFQKRVNFFSRNKYKSFKLGSIFFNSLQRSVKKKFPTRQKKWLLRRYLFLDRLKKKKKKKKHNSKMKNYFLYIIRFCYYKFGFIKFNYKNRFLRNRYTLKYGVLFLLNFKRLRVIKNFIFKQYSKARSRSRVRSLSIRDTVIYNLRFPLAVLFKNLNIFPKFSNNFYLKFEILENLYNMYPDLLWFVEFYFFLLHLKHITHQKQIFIKRFIFFLIYRTDYIFFKVSYLYNFYLLKAFHLQKFTKNYSFYHLQSAIFYIKNKHLFQNGYAQVNSRKVLKYGDCLFISSKNYFICDKSYNRFWWKMLQYRYRRHFKTAQQLPWCCFILTDLCRNYKKLFINSKKISKKIFEIFFVLYR